MSLTHAALKARQRAERDTHPEHIALRIHRALSWLERGEKSSDDLDAQFIFLWIAFNAAYASESVAQSNYTEKDIFRLFLVKLLSLDKKGLLESFVWKAFPQAIRVLLDNHYVFQPFWTAQSSADPEDNNAWERLFDAAKKRANCALMAGDTVAVLHEVFQRLYTLRNQLLHGGATWNSQVNRRQVSDGAALMGSLVPIIIEIMLDNTSALWTRPMYPVVS